MTLSRLVRVRETNMVVLVVLLTVVSVFGSMEGTWLATKPEGPRDTRLGVMQLRGGSATAPRSTIKVLRSNSGIKQEGQGQVTSSKPPGSSRPSTPPQSSPQKAPQQSPGSIFSKVMLRSKEAKKSSKVQVVGSWSGFKERSDMKKLPNGDWELIIELPMGRHEYKYVLNENDWICSEAVEITQDKQGNRNNVLMVEESRRAQAAHARAAEGLPKAGAGPVAEKPDDKVFVKDSSGIENARDVFQRLLEEEGKASERLQRAQAQLVETLKLEIDAGVQTLVHCQKHVAKYTENGEKGLVDLKANAAAKHAEIKAHVDAIRAVMDEKETAAIALVEQTSKSRMSRLEGQVAVCNSTLPEVYQLMEKVKSELDNCPKNPSAFVDGSQALIPDMEKLSLKLMNTQRPTIEADFDNLGLEVA